MYRDIMRIAVDVSKADFVQKYSGGADKPFKMYVDLLAFAASLGLSKGVKEPVLEKSNSPDPIRREVFDTYEYGLLIDIIAIQDSGDVRSFQNSTESMNERMVTFESYANAGLEIMQNTLKKFPDPQLGLEHLLKEAGNSESNDPGELDLSNLVE